jgi:hypothetical protein
MTVIVHQLPPASSSPNARAFWAKRYKDNKGSRGYAGAVYYECVQVRNTRANFEPFKRPVLQLTFVFRDHRKRDEDNLRTRFKSGQDAIVAAGLIEQDDMEHLVVNRPVVEVDPLRAPMTIIDLSEES